MKNMRGWFIWCGVGTVEMDGVAGMLCLEQHSDLTKKEALSMAEECAKRWPRVMVCQKSARYPNGAELGGYEPWGKWGICLEGGASNA